VAHGAWPDAGIMGSGIGRLGRLWEGSTAGARVSFVGVPSDWKRHSYCGYSGSFPIGRAAQITAAFSMLPIENP
jgi:hypothetical protein